MNNKFSNDSVISFAKLSEDLLNHRFWNIPILGFEQLLEVAAIAVLKEDIKSFRQLKCFPETDNIWTDHIALIGYFFFYHIKLILH